MIGYIKIQVESIHMISTHLEHLVTTPKESSLLLILRIASVSVCLVERVNTLHKYRIYSFCSFYTFFWIPSRCSLMETATHCKTFCTSCYLNVEPRRNMDQFSFGSPPSPPAVCPPCSFSSPSFSRRFNSLMVCI